MRARACVGTAAETETEQNVQDTCLSIEELTQIVGTEAEASKQVGHGGLDLGHGGRDGHGGLGHGGWNLSGKGTLEQSARRLKGVD